MHSGLFYLPFLTGQSTVGVFQGSVSGVVDSADIYVGDVQSLGYASYFDGTEWVSGIGVEADRPDYVTAEDIGLTFAVASFVGFKGETSVVTAHYMSIV